MIGTMRGATIFVAMLVVGCGRSEPATSSRSFQPFTAPSVRPALHQIRGLIDEAARAELRMHGGPIIDLGSADQFKYTRGHWRTGWSAPREQGGVGFSEFTGQRAHLDLRLVTKPAELVIRARSRGGPQMLTARLTKRVLGRTKVGTKWSVVRIPVSGIPTNKHVVLSLVRGGHDAKLDVDWLALVDHEGARPSLPESRVSTIALGGATRRALDASTERSYSFYIQPPPHSSLVFDTGSSANTEFVARAETADGELVELYRGRTTPGRFTEHVVDLSPFARSAIRLELATHGDAPDTGWGEPTIYMPGPASEPLADGAPAKNLIVVVMDTTRADSFGAFTRGEPTEVRTPAFDRFARSGTTFLRAYDNANWTKPSVTSLLSGLYPETHATRHAKNKIPDKVRFLSQHLDDHGFETVLMSGNAVLSKKFGFDRGWDVFDDVSDDDNDANGYRLYRRAAHWLDEHAGDGRFFLYLQSVDPHTPYRVPSSYSKRYFDGSYDGPIGSSFSTEEQLAIDDKSMHPSSQDLDWIRALYHGEVSYQDAQLRVLLDKIDQLGLGKDTIVVVTNDHGEELRDHGRMGHGHGVYDEMLRAPLAIRYPPLFPSGRRVADIVEEVDIAPTLVEALGLPPMTDVQGMSFLDLFGPQLRRRRPLYAIGTALHGMRSVRVGDWKLIVDDHDGWLHLFDIGRDPGELTDVAGSPSGSLPGRLCEVYLGEALASPSKARRLTTSGRIRTHVSQDVELGDKLERSLESLGYL